MSEENKKQEEEIVTGLIHETPDYGPQPDRPAWDIQGWLGTLGQWLDALFSIGYAAFGKTPKVLSEIKINALLGPPDVRADDIPVRESNVPEKPQARVSVAAPYSSRGNGEMRYFDNETGEEITREAAVSLTEEFGKEAAPQEDNRQSSLSYEPGVLDHLRGKAVSQFELVASGEALPQTNVTPDQDPVVGRIGFDISQKLTA